MRIAMVALLVAALAVAATPTDVAHAQVEPSGTDYVAALRECSKLTDTAAKLACLESASVALVGAVDSGDVRLVDRAEREKTRRGVFGFSLGRLFGGNDDKNGDNGELAEMETLISTITEVRQIDRKTYQFRIQEANALWQINEAPSRFISPRVGEQVEFKRAAFQSYFIRVGNQIGVKGKRIG